MQHKSRKSIGRVLPLADGDTDRVVEHPRHDPDAAASALLDRSWYDGGPTIRENVDGVGRGTRAAA